MQFRFTSLAVFVLTLALAAFAAPIPAVTPAVAAPSQPADVQHVLADLKSTTDSIISKLGVVSQATDATARTVAPVIGEFTTAIKSAQDQLAVVTSVEDGSVDDVGKLFAVIIKDISGAIQKLGVEDILRSDLVEGVVANVNGVLNNLVNTNKDLKSLISNALITVANVLEQFTLKLTMETLKL